MFTTTRLTDTPKAIAFGRSNVLGSWQQPYHQEPLGSDTGKHRARA